jgi:hypothetical protein
VWLRRRVRRWVNIPHSPSFPFVATSALLIKFSDHFHNGAQGRKETWGIRAGKFSFQISLLMA